MGQQPEKWCVYKENAARVAVIHPAMGRLGFGLAQEFEDLLSELLREGLNRIIIDCESVNFVDSCMLGILVDGYRKVGSDGLIGFCNLEPNIRSLLGMTRLDEVFKIYTTRKEALLTQAA